MWGVDNLQVELGYGVPWVDIDEVIYACVCVLVSGCKHSGGCVLCETVPRIPYEPGEICVHRAPSSERKGN